MPKKQVVWICFEGRIYKKDRELLNKFVEILKPRFECRESTCFKIEKGSMFSRRMYSKNDNIKKKVVWIYRPGQLKKKDIKIWRLALQSIHQQIEFRLLCCAIIVKGILYSRRLNSSDYTKTRNP